MSSADKAVVGTIRSLLKRTQRNREVKLDSELFGDGLGLDSLETAELSAMLEDELGVDPFSAGVMPETVQDIVDFYGDTSSDS